ncbi:E3 ubiquitin-protein ligase bre1 [Arachnomyces sp. PD_36]|nr:E3 ubiquitin-protein ligase bre1 [Arachnomyces sp. PD_36]
MTAIEASPVSLPESGLVKMEDRKRPAAYDHNDSAPPLKKQATSLNGSGKPHPDTDMPWRDDLERIQKDAIIRQMHEYKREKTHLESRLKELTKDVSFHNDHLRVIDGWFKQLIDEVMVIVGTADKPENGRKARNQTNNHTKHEADPNTADQSHFPSALLFTDHENFEKHLQERSEDIKAIISRIFSHSPKVSPEVSELQGQLTKKLAEEKVSIAELEKAIAEKQQLEERLEAASLRYMVAEKKLDRTRSLTVAKLEKQIILGPQTSAGDSSSSAQREEIPVNGSTDNGERNVDLEEAYNKSQAISEKQKDQLEKLEAENTKLITQITELNLKHTRPTDDDYAHTDLFKQLKSQHDDVIKRINHLEATNLQLRQEAEKLQAERTAYRIELEKETEKVIGDKEAQLAKAESDLTRIRNARDELLADQQIRKAAEEQNSPKRLQDLHAAAEARIKALEGQVERLRLQTTSEDIPSNPQIDELSIEELRKKYNSLDKQLTILNSELTSMQTAYTKTSSLASSKVMDQQTFDAQIKRIGAEKSRADQKYFSVMRSKEFTDQELRDLRMKSTTSANIITQLKDSEAATRSLLTNMEKQLTETKGALTASVTQKRAAEQQATESNIVVEGLKTQVAELQKLVVAKDSSLASATSSFRQAETEIEGLKSNLSDTKKSLESWKTKSLGNSSSEYEMLRSLALCTVCRRNFKDTAIRTCGHVFCKECVEERLTSRSRKCPNCNKSFGSSDHLHITL